jgi:ankyrin repeat protein
MCHYESFFCNPVKKIRCLLFEHASELHKMTTPQIEKKFLIAATWHGEIEAADQLLVQYPELSTASIHTAAVLGDSAAIRRFLDEQPAAAMSTSQAYGANPLTLLALSKYLSTGKIGEDHFMDAAQMLIDAGADVNAGFTTSGPFPEYETPLYGAAGVAHNARLTKLFIRHGADPNDIEAVYHSPETYHNDAMKVLVETGQIIAENLTLMLIRKHDLHDYEGVKYLLEKDVNPNGRWRINYPVHHALSRDNDIRIIKLLLDHGADPFVIQNDLTGVAHAAREGRGDVLNLIKSMGFSIKLQSTDRLIAACALGLSADVEKLLADEPTLAPALVQMGGYLLAKFSGAGNAAGVRLLLKCGVDVNSAFSEGDAYYQIPKNALAIHVAAWRARWNVVKVLLENGSKVDDRDRNGNTPLALAIKACTSSYWVHRRSAEGVQALLEAGADAKNTLYPTGYDEVDLVLKEAGR